MKGIGDLLARLTRDAPSRGIVVYLAAGGLLLGAVHLYAQATLDSQASAAVHAVALALYVGGLVYVLARALRARDAQEIEQLRTDSERFRSLTALSADWFWETDAEGRVTWLAGGAPLTALFGDARVVGRRLWEVEPVSVEPAALEELREQLAARLPFFELELARAAPEGARIIHRVSGEPRLAADGRVLGYRGVGRDATVQRAAEAAAADARQRLDLAVEGASLVLWDLDVPTDRLFMSARWAELFGREPKDEIIRAADLLSLVRPADRAAARAAFTRVLKGEVPVYEAEYCFATRPGEWRWLRAVGRVVERDAERRAKRISGITIDVDAAKRAEQALRDAETRYRALVELAPDAIIVHSGGLIEYANPAAARLLRGTPAQLAGMRVEDTVHPDDRPRAQERARFHASGPGASGFETQRLRRLDGAEAVVEAASISYLENGRLVTQTVLRDVSEMRRARDALAERERRFRDVVEAAGEFVWEVGADWRLCYLSGRVEAVLGYAQSEMLGRTLLEFMPLGEARAAQPWFEERLGQARAFRDHVFRVMTKAGRVIWVSMSGVPVLDRGGRPEGYRGTAADITARRQAEERLEYLAKRDALTGLPNRALLAERIQRAIVSAARSRGKIALLFVDLDQFRLVNDSLGHQAGDALLRAVAERLANTVRHEDMLARLGGDEFVLLWDGIRTPADAAAAAQRVQATLARPFTIDGRTLSIGASIGISVYPSDAHDAATLLRNADAAMHAAKEAGRNIYRFYLPEFASLAAERLALENDLRGALSRGEFMLHFHPVVRGVPGQGARIVGAEVLARWQHPVRGRVMPDVFVPVAEQSGLIRALGEWTIERSLAQIAAWQRRFGEPRWFAINVSSAELALGDAYVARLQAALQANRLDGRWLEIEVTERVLMSHLPENINTLRRVAALGVRVAIDDFGTGYSSLAYLRRLPIDKLKIDRSFLRELDSHPADAKIVQAIASMAHGLGLAVAAEGVETAAQLERLRALGCEEWQGHYFSAPLDAAAFEQLLAARNAAAS
ncbi:MAG: EAL domain-containing protein [Burkholderiales bacterium]|nr:EAL domain-containing protein [Burkholderiales bacterium]